MGKFKYVINGESSAQPVVAEFDVIESGLTKREAFAMAAMQGILSNETIMDYIKSDEDMTVVNQATDMADQLLKELEK